VPPHIIQGRQANAANPSAEGRKWRPASVGLGIKSGNSVQIRSSFPRELCKALPLSNRTHVDDDPIFDGQEMLSAINVAETMDGLIAASKKPLRTLQKSRELPAR
jgi:hypothetical protein